MAVKEAGNPESKVASSLNAKAEQRRAAAEKAERDYRDETDKVLSIVENGQKQIHERVSNQQDVFVQLIAKGPVSVEVTPEPKLATTIQHEDKYPCISSAMLGFVLGIILTSAIYYLTGIL